MKRGKKFLCMLLTSIMVLVLVGCGKEGEGLFGTSQTDGESSAADSQAAKEYVYADEEIPLGIDFAQVSLYGMSYADERLYILVEDYNDYIAQNFEVVENASQANEPAEETSEDASEAEASDDVYEEEVYNGWDYYLISADMDGGNMVIRKLVFPQITCDWGYISSYTLFEGGSVAVLYEYYYNDDTDPENSVYVGAYDLLKWDAQGDLMYHTSMIPATDDEYVYFYAQGFIGNEDGSLTIISGDNEIIQIDAQGQETSRISIDESVLGNVGQIIEGGDGSLYVTSYNDDWTEVYISTLDKNTGEVSVNKETTIGTGYSIYGGNTTDFLLSNSMGIYTYNLGDEEPLKLMDFINSDLATYGLYNITFIDDESFVANYYDTINYANHVSVFTHVDPADIQDKIVLTLGCQYLGSDIKAQVIEFNKTNSKYRITVKSYSEDGDYEQAETRMNNDIISGQMPDIMMIDSSQDITSWANKGLLADIRELIAADEELSQVEFLENVFEAFSINGTLYTVVPRFAVQTYVAKTSLVGDIDGWTMSEFQEFMATMGEDVSAFGTEMLRDTFIYYMMLYCGSDFVDVNTGTCNFQSEEFISMLEYAKSLPEEYDENYWNDYDWELYESQYRENRAVLLNLYISRVSDLVYTLHGYMGEEVTFVGFPGVSGNSSIIQPVSSQYAISAKSQNIEGAWEFVRYFLTDEYQSDESSYYLPVSKSAFEKLAAQAMEKPYWTTTDGEKVDYDNTYYINGEEIVLEQFSQAEVDAICEFVYSVSKRNYYNDDIINIITEEAASFFDGQKSAQDVAAIIQSRVQLYVDENR